jgi:alkylation response protein AidB-like acyl-CoA dehydrogenase
MRGAGSQDGSYIVNGLKKWITGGLFADFFTVAARTGDADSGMFGVSLMLIEKSMPGVSVRPMECMGVKGSGTAYVEFDDVRVPEENFIGGVDMLLVTLINAISTLINAISTRINAISTLINAISRATSSQRGLGLRSRPTALQGAASKSL